MDVLKINGDDHDDDDYDDDSADVSKEFEFYLSQSLLMKSIAVLRMKFISQTQIDLTRLL